MARFDVYHFAKGLVLDCQADLLQDMDRRFVIPLLPSAEVPSPTRRLHPSFEIRGQIYVMATHMAASVPVRLLGRRCGNLRDEHYAITSALDMLMSGY